MRSNSEHSALVIHAEKTHHIPDWGGAGVLALCKNKQNRKATEAAYIAVNETINMRVGSTIWAKSAAIFSVQGASR